MLHDSSEDEVEVGENERGTTGHQPVSLVYNSIIN
jgi:hypothetical protein